MKLEKRITFILFLMSICILNVQAKNTIMTCSYHKDADSLSQTSEVDIKCDIYDNDTHMCYVTDKGNSLLGNNNKEQLKNWGTSVGVSWNALSYIKNVNKCPEYLLIRYQNTYELHAAKDYADSITLQNYLYESTSQPRYHVVLVDSSINNENYKKIAEENIESYTYMINKSIEDYSLGVCKKISATSVNLDYCRGLVEELKNNISTWNANVSEYISKGYVKESDELVKKYREAVQKAETFIKQENEKIDKAVEDYNNSKNNSTDNSTSIPKKPSGADIGNFCNEDKIQKAFKFLGILLYVVKILVPILLIVLGVVDYSKAVVSSDTDAIQKSTKSLINRVIVGVIIFLIPTIVNFVFGLVWNADDSYNNCRVCIFEPGKCGK